MCGVPIERADDYLHRLIAKGHRVAVCEQLEDPAEAKKRGGKSVVRRDVIRLVTPGTITEERLLEPGRANILLAVQRGRPGEGRVVFGLAALDISTGAFSLGETDEAGLGPEIARIEPSEIVAPQALFDDPAFARLIGEAGIAATPLAREALDAASAARLVQDFYGVDTLEGFGAFSRAEVAAAGAGARLSQAHPVRRAAAAGAPGAPRPRRWTGDRRGDPHQSRTDPHAGGRARRLGDRDHRPDGDAGGRAADRRAAGEPADRSGGDR